MKLTGIPNHLLILFFLCCFIIFGSACKATDNSTETMQKEPEITTWPNHVETAELYEEEPEYNFSFEVDSYFDSDAFKYHYVYDNEYLGILLDYESVSLEEMLSVIDQNDQIVLPQIY